MTKVVIFMGSFQINWIILFLEFLKVSIEENEKMTMILHLKSN